MGDVIMTTPIIRCLKQQLPQVELHYLTTTQYAEILVDNPHIDQLHCYTSTTIEMLKKYHFDIIIDLHNGRKSRGITKFFKVRVIKTDKKPIGKWLYLLAGINKLNAHHVIDRHFDSISHLGITDDGHGMDLYSNSSPTINNSEFKILINLGGSTITKRIPFSLAEGIITSSFSQNIRFTLTGGADVTGSINHKYHNTINLINKLTIPELLSTVQSSDIVITGDTAVMHIAAAFQKPIIAVWGSTNQEFGFSPYYGHLQEDKSIHIEHSELKCRPCSKYGVSTCPKRHMKCLNDITVPMITSALNELIDKNFQ